MSPLILYSSSNDVVDAVESSSICTTNVWNRTSFLITGRVGTGGMGSGSSKQDRMYGFPLDVLRIGGEIGEDGTDWIPVVRDKDAGMRNVNAYRPPAAEFFVEAGGNSGDAGGVSSTRPRDGFLRDERDGGGGSGGD